MPKKKKIKKKKKKEDKNILKIQGNLTIEGGTEIDVKKGVLTIISENDTRDAVALGRAVEVVLRKGKSVTFDG